MTFPEGYKAVTEGAAIALRPDRMRLAFTGDDRATFLHNLLSNDITSLVSGAGCYANVLKQDSKVVGDAEVLVEEDRIFLDLEGLVCDRVRDHLERYLVADDVEIDSADDVTIGIYGPRAGQVLAAAGVDPPVEELSHRNGIICGQPVHVVRVNRTGGDGFEVHVTSVAAEVQEEIVRAGGSQALESVGQETLEILRVEAGIARAGVDFDESRLVLEAGLERGIHFRKGCYLGQEIVERQAARGHVNRKLVGLRFDGCQVPERGAVVRAEDRDVGEVTSAVLSPALGVTIALGYLRREVFSPGTRVEIAMGSDILAAEVVETPFVRRP